MDDETYVMISNTQDTAPTSYEMTMNDVDADQWQKAMISDMEFMYSNQVWNLTVALEEVKPIWCKWVYKWKRGQDVQVETCKVRLVAKGYNEREGVDYEDTFHR